MANKQTRFSLSEMSNWLIKKLFFLSIIVFNAFLLIGFFSYSANDPYYGFQTSGQISNITGFFGAYIAGTLLNYFDIISVLIPDTLIPEVYNKHIKPNLNKKQTLLFSHGFNISDREGI